MREIQLIVVMLLLGLKVSAEYQVEVKQKNQQIETFLFSDWRKITFENGNMEVVKKENLFLSIRLNTISSIHFLDKNTSCENVITPHKIDLLPNPVQNYLTIRSIDSKIRSILIVNMKGDQVYFKEVNEGQILCIDLSHLVPGVYLCRVGSEKGMYVAPFIRE